MAYKAPSIKSITTKVSVKPLTMPANSLKVGVGVKSQHMAKINWAKSKPMKQKGTSSL